jgi:MFS family permease
VTEQPAAPSLFAAGHRAVVLVFAGGVLLYAMNLYFTAALMPSVVTDIGGGELYAWVATAFLIAAVNASMLVSRALGRWGLRGAYLVAFLTFAVGVGVSAVTPAMPVLVAGRVVQGIGGGLLAGLGYAVIRGTLPQPLWVKATGLISAMWGIGALVGPSVGGVFAEFHAWRGAFALLAVAALGLAALAMRHLPARIGEPVRGAGFPLGSLTVLTLAAAAFSIGSTVDRGWPTAACLVAGGFLLGLFLLVDRRARAAVLPRITFRRGNSLKWIYLTVSALCVGVIAETYIPLFGQGLAGMSPFLAGFLGASLSLGWVTAQLISVRFDPRRARRAIRIAPFGLTVALLAFGALLTEQASAVRVVVWAAILVVAGISIGCAIPHLSVAALSASPDEDEAAKAAAALSTTQLIAYAIASSLTGVLVAVGDSLLGSARIMVVGLATLTAFGVITTTMLARATARSGADRPRV